MKKSILGFIFILIFFIPVCAFAEEFGDYIIDKNTKLDIYTTEFQIIAYRVRGNLIYEAYQIVPIYTIDGKRIKRFNLVDRLNHPSYSFDKNYIYSPYGTALYKIKGDKIYGGMGLLVAKFKIKKV